MSIATRCVIAVSFALSMNALVRAGEWPQWFGPMRDGVWRETGILTKFPESGPKVVWRQPIASGYAGPAIANGKCYVCDRDQKLTDDKKKLRNDKGLFVGQERIHCFDALTGKPVWTHAYDCLYSTMGGYPEGPRTTPSIHQGKLYSLGAMGDLVCLDAETGKEVWTKNVADEFKTKPPVWGYSASVLVDGDKVFVLVGGKDSVIVALNKDTGKPIWNALNAEEIGYAPAVMIEMGGKKQLIVWHTESLNGLDPETGTVYWSHAFPADGKIETRPAITVATPRLVGDVLFVSSPYFGCLALKLDKDKPDAKLLWAGKSKDLAKTDGLHCLMTTPVIKDGFIYGVCNAGELRCVNAATGERLWETYAATDGKHAFLAHAFVIEHENRFLIFNDHGDLIIANLTPKGYEEISRAKIIEPTIEKRGRLAAWAYPAFANKCIYVRNDKEIVCLSLAATS